MVNEQLQSALDSRVVLEQAKGVLFYSGDLSMPDACTALRTYARDHNIKLTDLARALVSRALPAALVLDHARTRDAHPARRAARTRQEPAADAGSRLWTARPPRSPLAP